MGSATTDFKRLFIQGLKWDSEDLTTGGTPTTFYQALKAASRARLIETKDGRVLTGSSGNGKTVTFTLPMNGLSLTPTDIANLCGEILRRYDLAQADLIAAGNATPSDDQIYAELLAKMLPLTESYCDFSSVRLTPLALPPMPP